MGEQAWQIASQAWGEVAEHILKAIKNKNN
jgi:hypothetical protein